MRRIAVAAALCLVAGGGTACAAEGAGTITISGAWALYPMAVRWAEEYRKLHPSVSIDIAAGGAGKGMADALAGAADIGMVSRAIAPAEFAKGAWAVAVTRDAVVPTVNAGNPALRELLRRGVTRERFAALWIAGRPATWGELSGTARPDPVRVYTRSDACGAAQTWAGYLGGTQEALKGVGVYGDPGLAEAVRKDPRGIGYNNVNFAYDAATRKPLAGLRVLPIDLDGDGTIGERERFYDDRDRLVAAIGDGRYPSPPARELYFVCGGRPARETVRAFIRWVLTDGQAYVPEAGYIRLAAETLRGELNKLDGAETSSGERRGG